MKRKGIGKPTTPLCEVCMGRTFTRDMGVCPCGKPVSSGMFKYCDACAREKGACASCGRDIGEVDDELRKWADLSRKAREKWIREN